MEVWVLIVLLVDTRVDKATYDTYEECRMEMKEWVKSGLEWSERTGVTVAVLATCEPQKLKYR